MILSSSPAVTLVIVVFFQKAILSIFVTGLPTSVLSKYPSGTASGITISASCPLYSLRIQLVPSESESKV